MTIDLASLSSKELDTLITKAKKRKVALKKRKPAAAVRRKIAALAKAEGRKLGKVAPKYRNPAKPSETWTGRGKQPRWMAAETAKGRKAEDFLIK